MKHILVALALVPLLLASSPAQAGDEFEDGFNDELGRIAAHEAVYIGRGLLARILLGPPPGYYPPPAYAYPYPVPVYRYAYPPPAYWGHGPYAGYYHRRHHHHHGHHHHGDCD